MQLMNDDYKNHDDKADFDAEFGSENKVDSDKPAAELTSKDILPTAAEKEKTRKFLATKSKKYLELLEILLRRYAKNYTQENLFHLMLFKQFVHTDTGVMRAETTEEKMRVLEVLAGNKVGLLRHEDRIIALATPPLAAPSDVKLAHHQGQYATCSRILSYSEFVELVDMMDTSDAGDNWLEIGYVQDYPWMPENEMYAVKSFNVYSLQIVLKLFHLRSPSGPYSLKNLTVADLMSQRLLAKVLQNKDLGADSKASE